jgi:hypothetical protein
MNKPLIRIRHMNVLKSKLLKTKEDLQKKK